MKLEGGACITLLADKSKNINLQIFLFLSDRNTNAPSSLSAFAVCVHNAVNVEICRSDGGKLEIH